MARRHGLRFMVRLVKGAYWDGEIKRAQEAGLPGYPVFTHKQHTDISYLACARALIGHHDVIYPQFATHNAGTIAAILQMAREQGADFEFQRLHGMSEGIYREVLAKHAPAPPSGAWRVPPSTRRSASTATCWPTWCGACWRTAPTRRSCTSWPTRRSAPTSCWPRRCRPGIARACRCRLALYGAARANSTRRRPGLPGDARAARAGAGGGAHRRRRPIATAADDRSAR